MNVCCTNAHGFFTMYVLCVSQVVLELSKDEKRIERLRLQVLSGVEAHKVLLETVVETSTCVPVVIR